jgi:hypothetical protein
MPPILLFIAQFERTLSYKEGSYNGIQATGADGAESFDDLFRDNAVWLDG